MSLNSINVIFTNPVIEALYKKSNQFSTSQSAGMDLYASIPEPLEIAPGETVLVSAGFKIFIDNPDYAATILPRSGKGAKDGLVLGNLVGLIDSDYQGDLLMAVWNRNKEKIVTINPLDKICQIVFIKVERPSLNVVSSFNEVTDRGDGGFGHTGS